MCVYGICGVYGVWYVCVYGVWCVRCVCTCTLKRDQGSVNVKFWGVLLAVLVLAKQLLVENIH